MRVLLLLLCFYVHLCCSQIVNQTALSAATRQLLSSAEGKEDNVIFSGNYLVINCGVNSGTNGEQLAHNRMPQFFDYLQDLVPDISLGDSSNGYKAFFKSAENQAQVQRTILDIFLGTNPPITEGGQYPIRQPVLACVTEVNNYERLFEWCQANPTRWVFISYNVVFLCPAFFHLPPVWIVNACPQIIEHSYWPSDQNGLRNQYAIFVQAMASQYLRVPMSSINIQAAVDLDEGRSALSVSNYAYYAASKIVISRYNSFSMVLTQQSAHQAGCPYFPDPSG